MNQYYATNGELGELLSTGYQSESVVEGLNPAGWFIRKGAPESRYTEKASVYDVWDVQQGRWVTNPEQVALEVELANEKAEIQWKIVRSKRTGLLLASDWTQLSDVPAGTKETWATYRQALRDITEQPDPFNIVWPMLPQ